VRRRLIAVLGYSGRGHHGLHDVCGERLSHAERLAEPGDVVLLSGWARHGDGGGESELMREAWNGPEVQLIADSTARNTRENAVEVAQAARWVSATEVVVVTSGWHAQRARALVRAALGTPGVPVESSSPPGAGPVTLLARELLCLAALPVNLFRVRS
jgi:uncharacterized SAM-binding protein YcdF (DUF218 family)